MDCRHYCRMVWFLVLFWVCDWAVFASGLLYHLELKMTAMETIVGLCVMLFFMGGTLGVLSVALVSLLKAMYNRVAYLEAEEAKRQQDKTDILPQ